MTPQRRMEAKLRETGIPAKTIRCYGSQIVVTALSADRAREWVDLLRRINATIRTVAESVDVTQNRETGRKTVQRVWRVFATVTS